MKNKQKDRQTVILTVYGIYLLQVRCLLFAFRRRFQSTQVSSDQNGLRSVKRNTQVMKTEF
jgi:hypothetical protein